MQYSLLNLLRFFAAFLVVLHHFAYNIPPFDHGFLNNILGNGHFAVTFFFVLSGFVMVLSNEKIDFSNRHEKILFWKKRAIRLLPLYYFALILFIVPSLFFKTPINWNEFTQNIFGVQAWSFMAHPRINPPSWSLSVEFFFYLLTPFILYFLTKIKFRHFALVITGIWISSILVFKIWGNERGNDFSINFFPLVHLGTFLIGILTGKLWLRQKEKIVLNTNYWILLIVVGFTLLCVFLTTVYYRSHIPLLAPVFGLLIFLVVAFEYNIEKIRTYTIFNFLGQLSYPIYILHWPFMIYYNYLAGHANTLNWLLKYSISLLVFCVVIHFTIERYFKKKHSQKTIIT